MNCEGVHVCHDYREYLTDSFTLLGPLFDLSPLSFVAAAGAAGGASSVNATGVDTAGAAPHTEVTQSTYPTFDFAPLWQRLSECLAIVEENADLNDVATVLLPVVESLMVVCKYTTTAGASAAPLSPRSPTSETPPAPTTDDAFLRFTDAHRKILNAMVRNNPALMSGSFALLVENPKVLDFENKRSYFSQQLRRRPNKEHAHTLQVSVRRDFVFEDSFSKFQRWSPEQIKYGKLSCKFWNEEGVDAGGVAREWFS